MEMLIQRKRRESSKPVHHGPVYRTHGLASVIVPIEIEMPSGDFRPVQDSVEVRKDTKTLRAKLHKTRHDSLIAARKGDYLRVAQLTLSAARLNTPVRPGGRGGLFPQNNFSAGNSRFHL
jgi:hypothetical protein